MPDQIESGTYAIAAAASRGSLTIHGFIAGYQDALLSKFKRVNVNYEIIDKETIKILPSDNLRAFNLKTEVYPGFPTDLQAPMAVLATQAEGTSAFHETIFEGRLGYLNELTKMGSDCKILDTHQATITGPTPLSGTRITSFDLRAGATLIIAAIIAKGESRLDQIEIIDRGYEEIEKKLNSIGAKIKRVRLKEIE
jgi:UDP-N-acetylglucosamine 1-carboxyvinyltransferase